MTLETLVEPVLAADRAELAELLIACVNDGASIGFLAPLSRSDAASYWDKIIAELRSHHRVVQIARHGAKRNIVGSAQLAFEARANGRHRAEVQKVMVHPASRRQGIAAALMSSIEMLASHRGIRLLILDTAEGRSGARAFYEALNYEYVGGIPGYALEPDGSPVQNAIYYKTLAPAG